MKLRTCVSPEGSFIFGLHQPSFSVINLRENTLFRRLGTDTNGTPHTNQVNFPDDDLYFDHSDAIYEVSNPLSFRGTTYIGKKWADRRAQNPLSIGLPKPSPTSMTALFDQWFGPGDHTKHFADLPEAVLLSLAANATDSKDLIALARISGELLYDNDDTPTGLRYTTDTQGRIRPVYYNEELFEVVINNPALPDIYKEVMVLRPGVQGSSEIVGDWQDTDSHVFEYLRSNSYIPWGHWASNMANDSIRYTIADLSHNDMKALRHIYYQRLYVRIAEELDIPLPGRKRRLSEDELETLRQKCIKILEKGTKELAFTATLWGWNYGFDYAPSHYRLHASHQQIHQQFAMIPETVASPSGGTMASYGCGDMVAECCHQFRKQTGKNFFQSYLSAIQTNKRMDHKQDLPQSLIVHEDAHCILFVPKAQTSQWELQLMAKKPVGNILEADMPCRSSLDLGIYLAMKSLTGLGAQMITTIEFPKRLNNPDRDQRLLYSFMPKLPQSMGAFSEAQLRYINGHYPEDFAFACKTTLESGGFIVSDNSASPCNSHRREV